MYELVLVWSIGVAFILLPIFISLGFLVRTEVIFPKKSAFVITSSSLAYGISFLLSLPIAPLGFACGYYAQDISAAGYPNIAAATDWFAEYWEIISLVLIPIFGFIVPNWLKRKWPAIIQATL